MQKLIGSRSSNLKEKSKEARHRDRPRTSNAKQERSVPLLDIGTLLEMQDELAPIQSSTVLVYSIKFCVMRSQRLWECASNKGYFLNRTRSHETVLRPILRLYNSVTDVTSDCISSSYDLRQPFLMVRSRKQEEPFCRLARQSWLQLKVPRRALNRYRLLGIAGVCFPKWSIDADMLDAILNQAMTGFREPGGIALFPVVSGLAQHSHSNATFLRKMQLLRNKCRASVAAPQNVSSVLPVLDWPWATTPQVPHVTEDEDDVNADSGALAAERRELHTSREVSVCLLYRLALVTHSILQYLVFINVGGKVVQEFAEEVLVVAVRQQMTESVLEMYLDPSTRIVNALFEAVMTRAATVVQRGTSSKHLRVRTLQQCRLGSAVASWQLATLLLAGIGEAFSEAAITEMGREEKTRKYCQDCLNLIPRLKDDCLYQLFRALSLRHKKLGLLRAQHKEPLDPVAERAVVLLTKIAVTYALHLFRTQRVPLRHTYLHEQDLQDDFAHFLSGLQDGFSVAVPQSPTTMDTLTGNRLKGFMTDMLVRYYKEVVEASNDNQQTALD